MDHRENNSDVNDACVTVNFKISHVPSDQLRFFRFRQTRPNHYGTNVLDQINFVLFYKFIQNLSSLTVFCHEIIGVGPIGHSASAIAIRHLYRASSSSTPVHSVPMKKGIIHKKDQEGEGTTNDC